jgi:undecaprenyl-diphosphatase
MSLQLRAPKRGRPARAGPAHPHPVGDWKVVALRLAGGAVTLWGLLALLGMLVTHVLVHGQVQSMDRGVDVWFAARRMGVWNSITMFGSGLALTQTAIALTVVMVLLLRWRLGRWYESWIVVAAMVGELLVFYAVTATVHRPRPPVARLDMAPPTSSFPSGHTAAAFAL